MRAGFQAAQRSEISKKAGLGSVYEQDEFQIEDM